MDELDEIFEIKLAASDKEYKGLCSVCNEGIIGQQRAIKAMGKMFHQEHFTCEACKGLIASDTSTTYLIHPVQNKPFHTDCYEKMFYEECQGCHKRINDGKILHASGGGGRESTYHPECFKCGIPFVQLQQTSQDQESERKEVTGCGKFLEARDLKDVPLMPPNQRYFIQQATVFCEQCYESNFVPSCNHCSRKIKNDIAPGGDADAAKIRYYAYEGKAYCAPCYDQLYVPTCKRCDKKIKKDDGSDGLYLTTGKDKYHPSCFSCFECGKAFEDLKAFVINDTELYCREHYDGKARDAAIKAGEQAKNSRQFNEAKA